VRVVRELIGVLPVLGGVGGLGWSGWTSAGVFGLPGSVIVSSELSALHERLVSVVGDRTYRSLGDETGHNAETVRRYMQGQAPSAEFLSRVCEVYDVNAHWLMTGVGAARQSESAADVLRGASPSDLLSAVADTLERLIERVDRLEVFVQTMETRVRAGSRGGVGGEGASGVEIGVRVGGGGGRGRSEQGGGRGGGGERGRDGGGRAEWVADAVAERSPSDAD
jgi:transcriptional regulator with XRE-family HTH domain